MHRLAIAVAAIALAALTADAATLRWSSQGDYLTADPMAQNELLTNSINGHVYESLVMRGKKLEILPGLAASWKQTSPTTWVFNLRKGVKCHDGSDFTADDVVFSIKRLQGPTSNFRVYGNAVGKPKQDRQPHGGAHHPGAQPGDARDARQQPLHDEQGVGGEEQRGEDAGLHQQGGDLHRAQRHGHRARTCWSRASPDVKSVFKKNPNWWGLKEKGYWDGNVDEIVYTPIKEGPHAHGGAARRQHRLRARSRRCRTSTS